MPLNDSGWLVLDHISPFLREKPMAQVEACAICFGNKITARIRTAIEDGKYPISYRLSEIYIDF